MSALFGDRVLFPQENGPDIELIVFGDEMYARRENLDGYTVVYDTARGLYCYAVVFSGRFVSSGITATAPPPAGLRKHLHESEAVRSAQATARIIELERFRGPMLLEAPLTIETFGPNNGLLTGRRVSQGAVLGLTVLIDFQDMQTTITPADVDAMLNQPGYNTNGNAGSVRDYYRAMSSGLLDYRNRVIGPITLSKKRADYVGNLLVGEALDKLVALGIDFRDFDSRGEGIVDAINFMYAGASVFEGNLWPHNSVFSRDVGNGVRTNFYQLVGLGQSAASLRIGTFCHENGHMLCRFPDMYDYGSRGREGDFTDSAGIGNYCLMGAGNYNDDSRTPSPICAYLRHLVGWCPNVIEINDAGEYTAKQGSYDTVHLYRTVRDNEYFLIENRSSQGYDLALPTNGLAVYHCDVLGSNEFQQGSASQHYQCALLQADGLRDLENNVNRGGPGDLFDQRDGMVLDDMTRPHSRLWDGSDSMFIVSDISAPGENITFRTGAAGPSALLGEAIAFHVNPLSAVRLLLPEYREREAAEAFALDAAIPPEEEARQHRQPITEEADAPFTAASPTFDGVDVSNHQGDVNWAHVKAAGARFAFLKATEGQSLKDARFAANRSAARAQGVPCGAYHFFRPLTDAAAQARNFVQSVGSLERDELLPVLDVEWATDRNGDDQWKSLSVEERVRVIAVWLTQVEAALGKVPMIYTASSFWQDYLNDARQYTPPGGGSPRPFSRHPLWVAHYTNAAAPRLPAAWTDYAVWQFSETGQVNGIAGNADLDRLNVALDRLKVGA